MISYEGKLVLAPMVRVGTLPMRLLALDYGADLVWSPELVDKAILGATRQVNQQLGTVDYISQRTLVFRTHPRERPRLVLQLGSADPQLALAAARLVADDVSGIDLNCGCPKHFSVHAGMGAALLRQPARLVAILRTLVEGLPHLPISAKIRLLPTREETLELVKEIATTGIRALTVHFRTSEERPRHVAHHEWLPDIAQLCPFPIIANGDIFTAADVAKMRALGAASCMIARAAQWNVSVFRRASSGDDENAHHGDSSKELTERAGNVDHSCGLLAHSSSPLLPERVVSADYLRMAMSVENPFSNTKYTLLQMWLDRPCSDHRLTSQLQTAKSYADLCNVFGVVESERNSISDETRWEEEGEKGKEKETKEARVTNNER